MYTDGSGIILQYLFIKMTKLKTLKDFELSKRNNRREVDINGNENI